MEDVMETLVNEEQVCERVSTPADETTNDVAMTNNEAVDCPTVGTDQSSSTVFTLGLENLDEFVRCCDTPESRDIRDRIQGWQPFDNKILNKEVTETKDLLKQIKIEIKHLNTCRLQINHQVFDNVSESVYLGFIEYMINRIHNLYEYLFSNFPVEEKSLLSYIQFNENTKIFVDRCSTTLSRLISRFHDDPNVYIIVARHEFRACSNVKAARYSFGKGLEYHNNSPDLLLAEFFMEVLYVEKSLGVSQMTAFRKYENMINIFKNDVKFHSQIVHVVLDTRSTRHLQCCVVRDMINFYKDCPEMWKKMAQIHFAGFVYDHESNTLRIEDDSAKKYKNFFKTYETAMNENSDPNFRTALWCLYLEDVIDIHSRAHVNSDLKDYLNDMTMNVFANAHKNNAISKTQYYIYWAESVATKSNERINILRKAITTIQDDIEIWSNLLMYYLLGNHILEAIKLFRRGVEVFQSDAMPLWDIITQFITSTNDYNEVTDLFNSGSSVSCSDIAITARVDYLEWFQRSNKIESTRELFKNLCELQPPAKSLYMKMISIEKSLSRTSSIIDIIISLYDEAIKIFGKRDTELWLDRIRYDYMCGHGLLADSIYNQSLTILDEEFKDTMETCFNKFKESFTNTKDVIELDDDDE